MGNMFRGNSFVEAVKYLGSKGLQNVSVAISGVISSVDPDKYLAKVMLGTLGVETGWIPIGTISAGAGYGIVAIPEQGTEVTVVFDHGDIHNGKIILSNFNVSDLPPSGMNPGEIYIEAKNGAKIKFDHVGHVVINGGVRAVAGIGDSVDLNPNSSTYGQIITGNKSILI